MHVQVGRGYRSPLHTESRLSHPFGQAANRAFSAPTIRTMTDPTDMASTSSQSRTSFSIHIQFVRYTTLFAQ